MATRTIKIYGYNFDADSTATVLWDGASVHSGPITLAVGSKRDTTINYGEIFSFTFTNADDTISSSHTLSIDCTAGEFSAGSVFVDAGSNAAGYPEAAQSTTTIGDVHFYFPGNTTYGDGADATSNERTNLLIDGVVPVDLATWTRDDGTVDGIEKSTWIYPLEVGNTLTCSVTVLPHIAVYVAPEPEAP